MGVEAFGVSMRLIKPGVFDHVIETLTSYDNVRMDRANTVAGFETATGEYNDGTHLIDLQILRDLAENKCTLAVRFSLCSYETIDHIFVNLVGKILSLFEGDVWLMTSALKQKANYLPGDERWLIAALPDEISAMRQYWQNLFGDKQGAVRVKDSFTFVGVGKKLIS
jgi:hypothetical protein